MIDLLIVLNLCIQLLQVSSQQVKLMILLANFDMNIGKVWILLLTSFCQVSNASLSLFELALKLLNADPKPTDIQISSIY